MSRPQIRAVVLAAGLGTRLRPLTATVPKPLLPVLGRPLVEHTLERLPAIGCEAAALNLHHLAAEVRERLGARFENLPLVYSAEERLLGTLGALGPLRDFLEPADLVVVVNGDSLCRWPLERLVERHLATLDSAKPAAATLLFSRRADAGAFGGGVRIDEANEVRAFRGEARSRQVPGHVHRVFAGAHVLSRELLDRLPDGRSDFVTNLYEPLLSEGAVLQAVETDEPWHDLGTPFRYLEGVLAWQRMAEDEPHGDESGTHRGETRSVERSSWVAAGVKIDPDSRVHRAVVETGVVVAEGVEIDHSVVLPGAWIGAGCRVTGSVVGPRAELQPGAVVESQMVTVEEQGDAPPDGATLIDGQVFTPIR